jgi:hypothetical protein
MTADAVDRFLADPSEYFDHSLTTMMSLDRAEVEALQLRGLTHRLSELRGSLPMLDRLAETQDFTGIERVSDVLPLLFDHATYKSYPRSLIDQHRYGDLTRWFDKLTTTDLSGVDVSSCRSIDDWMATLKERTPLSPMHTSGTSGSISFLPWSKAEISRAMGQFPLLYFQEFGDPMPAPRRPLNLHCIYPFFRTGGLSHTVFNDGVVEVIAGSEERFHAAYPGRLSADVVLLSSRLAAAERAGVPDGPVVDPSLAARREEFEVQQREMPRHVAAFFEAVSTELHGERVFMVATSNLLWRLAESGLARGLRGVFAADSTIVTGGGGKGIALPDDWAAQVREFLGVRRLNMAYGMSEMAGQFPQCTRGHYHLVPWIVPFVLDPDSGRELPREGTVAGAFAFVDLLPDTRWGGFVTGDRVTLVRDVRCPCGQASPYLLADIRRLSELSADDDDKLSCANVTASYTDAVEFLNDGVV